jgi:hypothetical protein
VIDWPQLLKVFGASALWRATGLHAAGETLVHALASRDENVRISAGMFLVKGGGKALPLLRRALDRRESVPIVLSIIGDIGDGRGEVDVNRFSNDPVPEVAKAAQDALKVLRRAKAADD